MILILNTYTAPSRPPLRPPSYLSPHPPHFECPRESMNVAFYRIDAVERHVH